MLRRFFDMKKCAEISQEERYLMIIASQLMKDKSSELLLTLNLNKFYLRNRAARLFIIIDFSTDEACVINHVFKYDIKMSARVSSYIYKKFTKEVEKRRNEMEDEYRNSVNNSLHNVLDNYFKDIARACEEADEMQKIAETDSMPAQTDKASDNCGITETLDGFGANDSETTDILERDFLI